MLRKTFKKINGTAMSAEALSRSWPEVADTSSIMVSYCREFVTFSTSAFGEKFPVYQKMVYSGTDYKVLGAVGNNRKDNNLLPVTAEDITTMITCDKKPEKPAKNKPEEKPKGKGKPGEKPKKK